MARTPTPAARDVLEVDWPFFGELCRALALHVARDYDPDVVVGVAKAGVIPAAIVASILQRLLVTIVIGRPGKASEPELIVAPPPAIRGRRVLIVDETCNSGNTMKLAVNAVKAQKPADIRTAVSFLTGPWQPDFHAFVSDKSIVLPWDREIIENGELVTRPDLRAWLQRKK